MVTIPSGLHKKLESVQRLFTKRLNGYRGLTYAEWLKKPHCVQSLV